MSKEPQKITTEIILADFVPAPMRTPEVASQIEAAIRADNQAALTQIIQMTHAALAVQQNQINQIATQQQAEINQIRQEIRQLNQQPQITYNISDNRSINTNNSWNSYSQSTYSENYSNFNQNSYTHNAYQGSWGSYDQSAYHEPDRTQQSYSQQGSNSHQYIKPSPYAEEDSGSTSLSSWWPLPLIILIAWGAWACENQQNQQQTPPAIQRAR